MSGQHAARAASGPLQLLLRGPQRPRIPPETRLRAQEFEHHDQHTDTASLRQILRALPAIVRTVTQLSWRISPLLAVGVLVSALLSGVASATGLLAANHVLTTIFAAGPTPHRVFGALGQIAVLALVVAARAGLISVVTAGGARLGPGVRRIAESRLIAAAAHVDLSALDDPDYHDELRRAFDRSLPMLEQAVTQCVSMLTAAITLAAATVTVALLHPVLPVAVLLSALPAAWCAIRSSQLRHRSLHQIVSFDRRVRIVTDLLTDRDAAAELRAFGAQPDLIAEYDSISRIRESVDSFVGLAQEYHAAVGRTATGIATVGVYAVLGALLYTGAIPLAVAATALVALQSAHTAVTQLAQSTTRLHEQGLFVLDYHRVLATCDHRTRPHTGAQAPLAPRVIELDRVSFRYPGSRIPAVHEVTATITTGQVIALVGENGSGKTTLAKLLAGLYLPDDGEIRWDGTTLTDFTPESVAARTAVIMQNPTRWPLTARAATTLGTDPAAVDEQLLTHAARVTGADQVIDRLPDGWDTLLSKQFTAGRDLSGGQWQRLAAARALYRDAAILIADEPTASLDARAEAQLHDTLHRLALGRTVILITHRLTTVRMADIILVMHQGELIETGTHDELLSTGGRYAQMYRIQADLYAQTG